MKDFSSVKVADKLSKIHDTPRSHVLNIRIDPNIFSSRDDNKTMEEPLSNSNSQSILIDIPKKKKIRDVKIKTGYDQ